jgi:hypothetical protein
MNTERLLKLEEQFWKGDADFYRRCVTDDGLMVFPEPVGVLTKGQTVRAIEESPRWTTVHFEAPRVVELESKSVLLVYKAVAKRTGGAPYATLASSAYVEVDGEWLLTFHQQTPA